MLSCHSLHTFDPTGSESVSCEIKQKHKSKIHEQDIKISKRSSPTHFSVMIVPRFHPYSVFQIAAPGTAPPTRPTSLTRHAACVCVSAREGPGSQLIDSIWRRADEATSAPPRVRVCASNCNRRQRPLTPPHNSPQTRHPWLLLLSLHDR